MIDLVQLIVRAGNGGFGRVSFRREKYVPKGGPDGGMGGHGGSIIVRAVENLSTLKHLAGVKEVVAQSGEPGGKRQKFGAKAEDIVIEVPVGTTIWLLAENKVSRLRREKVGIKRLLTKADIRMERYYLGAEGQALPDREPDLLDYERDQEFTPKSDFRSLPKTELVVMEEVGQEIVLTQGGFGGRGNESFKSSEQTTPLTAEYGSYGEQKLVIFELKLLADVGLVGFPNAGKSTLLARITKARPKVASYPFTTLEPHLGIMKYEEHELVIADIPGLVEGASSGKGLGYDFLRHIENCRAVLMLLSLDETDIYQAGEDDRAKLELLWRQYQTLTAEMKEYGQALAEKPMVVALSKSELYTDEFKTQAGKYFKQKKIKLLFFSSSTGDGLEALKAAVVAVVS